MYVVGTVRNGSDWDITYCLCECPLHPDTEKHFELVVGVIVLVVVGVVL